MLKMIFLPIFILLALIFSFFFVGISKERDDIVWGVNFSSKHAKGLGLDSRKTYLALLDDLKAEKIKIAVHWDVIEPEKGEYDFKELDFNVNEAEKRGVKLLLVVGMKTPRWPECHLPDWSKGLSKKEQQERILKEIESIVSRYGKREAVWAFQVENEPFFPFGNCPWADEEFLKEEINLVKSLTDKPVIVSTTGEFSLWFEAAKLGDIVGVTTYKKVWFKEFNTHLTYPLPAVFYRRRAYLVKKIFNKDVLGVELQAEPWGKRLLYDSPLEEQMKSMDIERLRKNIIFGKKIGFKENYLWGAEWWFWMKEKHNDSSFWNEAKKLWE